MKLLRNSVVAAVMLGTLSVFALAQDASLRMLPDDTSLVINVDLKSLFSILPEDVVAEMRSKSMQETGIDLFGSSHSIVTGVSSNAMTGSADDVYVLFRGNLTVEALINAVKAKGDNVTQKQIAGLTAYTSDEESGDMMQYVASAGPGLLVFGSPEGLEKYQKVATGQAKNATGNAALISASQDVLPNSFFSVYGLLPESVKTSGPPQFADINSMALAANYASDFLTIRMVFNANSEESLQALDMMIKQYSQMSSQMDSSGTFTEFIDNLKTEINGTKMIITTGMSKAGMDKLVEQIKSMAGLASSVEKDYDQDNDY